MMRRLLVLSLAAVLVPSPAVRAQGLATADSELAKGIRQAQAGEFDAAVMTLDASARRLAAEGGRARELSRAYAYLAIAYLGLNHEQTAKAKFLEAWRADQSLTMGTDEFPPNVVTMFDEVRRQALAEQASAAPAPAPRATPAAAPPPTRKRRGKGPLILLALGGAAAAGVAIAGGGDSPTGPGPSATTTTVAAAPRVAFTSGAPPPGSTLRPSGINGIGEPTFALALSFTVTSSSPVTGGRLSVRLPSTCGISVAVANATVDVAGGTASVVTRELTMSASQDCVSGPWPTSTIRASLVVGGQTVAEQEFSASYTFLSR